MSRARIALMVALLAACQSGASAGTACTRASDCASPLVCRLGRCRSECAANRDCPLGAQCFLDQNALGACELEQDHGCGTASACGAGLDCLRSTCVRSCASSSECAADGSCSIASGSSIGVCVDPRPFDAGVPSDASVACSPLQARSICANGGYA